MRKLHAETIDGVGRMSSRAAQMARSSRAQFAVHKKDHASTAMHACRVAEALKRLRGRRSPRVAIPVCAARDDKA